MKTKKLVSLLCVVAMFSAMFIMPAQAATLKTEYGRVFDGTDKDKVYFDFIGDSNGTTPRWIPSTSVAGYTGAWGFEWNDGVRSWGLISKQTMPEEYTLTTSLGKYSNNHTCIYLNAEFSSVPAMVNGGNFLTSNWKNVLKNGYKLDIYTQKNKIILYKYVNGTETEIETKEVASYDKSGSATTVTKEKIFTDNQFTGYKITLKTYDTTCEFTDTTTGVVTGGKAGIGFTEYFAQVRGITWTTANPTGGISGEVTKAEDGTVSGTVNCATDEANYVAVVAVYDANDRMLGVAVPEISDGSATFSIQAGDTASYCKAFLWDSMDNMSPISSAAKATL